MADREGARKTPQAMVLSTCPDVCKTPMGPNLVPVPYPIVAYCSMVTGEAQTVNMTGCKVVTKATKITCVFGDEPGVGGGAKSGVNKSTVEFISASTTVYCEKQPVIRHLDDAQMNNSNVPGKVQYPLASGGSAGEAEGAEKPKVDEKGEVKGDTNPPPKPEGSEAGWAERANKQIDKRIDELKAEYSSMLGTARDAVGLGGDNTFGSAWGRIWNGTKAVAKLGYDLGTAGAKLSNPGMAPVLDYLNPGATDRVAAVGEHMAKEVYTGYATAYAEGGLAGAAGRGLVDTANLAAQVVVGEGVGKVAETAVGVARGTEVAEQVATKVDDVERAASKVDDVERAATKTDDVLASQGGEPPSGGGKPPEGGGGSGGGNKGGGNGGDKPPDDPNAPKEPEKPKKPEEGGSSESGSNGVVITKLPAGGSYKALKKAHKNKGKEVHHMPAKSASDLDAADGPAIAMDPADHHKTASYDNLAGSSSYRQTQADLIGQGKFREAMEMDISDIRSKFGNKYDGAIDEMISYAKGIGKW